MENNKIINSTEEVDIEESEYIPSQNIKDYKFITMGGDIQIRQLVEQMVENDIEIPSIQRQYVWSSMLASRFLESVLLDLPLPSIFLCKENNGKYLIVDGLQRLTTLKLFLNGEKDSNSGKPFKIANSKNICDEWRGKTFRELSPVDQRKLKNKTIHAIIVEQINPGNYDGLFLIFERINSGGLQLNQQEIRNAIYHGSYNDMLFELNENPLWRRFFGTSNPHKRMKDIEMILRFFALRNLGFDNTKKGSISYVSTLNKHMEENKNNLKEYLDNEKEDFILILNLLEKFFGDSLFCLNIDADYKLKRTKKFRATLYDAIMLATDYCIKKKLNISSNKQNLINLFLDENFKVYINSHTSEKKSLFGRISSACKILYGVNYEPTIRQQN